LVLEVEEKIPFGKPKQRWENNIKMDLKYGMDHLLRTGTTGGLL
jgi:hypothetical protein